MNLKMVDTKSTSQFSIKTKYLKYSLTITSLFFIFATTTILFVFFHIYQNAYQLEYQRIQSIFPEIERAIENEVIIGNARGIQMKTSYIKKIYAIDLIDISKNSLGCNNKKSFIKRFACEIFLIDKFKEKFYVKVMNKVKYGPINSLICLTFSFYLFLLILTLLILYFYIQKLNRIIIYPLIDLAINPRKCFSDIQYVVQEIELIRSHLKDYYNKLEETKSQEEQIKFYQIINEFSLQIVHDLRSPIAALNTLKQYANFKLEIHKNILTDCIKRMDALVGELLYDKNNRLTASLQLNSCITNLSNIIDNVVNEKNILLNHLKKTIKINVIGNNSLHGFINPSFFTNIVSNLLNNAIEAIVNEGTVTIYQKCNREFIIVEISDDGLGMSQIILDNLGTHKISINKQNGSGIGLYSAFNYLKMIGGDLKAVNNLLGGATVSITIPCPQISNHHGI